MGKCPGEDMHEAFFFLIPRKIWDSGGLHLLTAVSPLV